MTQSQETNQVDINQLRSQMVSSGASSHHILHKETYPVGKKSLEISRNFQLLLA